METITIWADGACRYNNSPNPEDRIGAYAYKIQYKEHVKFGGKAVKNTTNNVMELNAVIEALKTLKSNAKQMQINIFIDSNYVVKGLTEWWDGWVRKNFKDVKNLELWKLLKSLYDSFPNISISWVKGHSGNKGNEDVDRYCNQLMDDVEKIRG